MCIRDSIRTKSAYDLTNKVVETKTKQLADKTNLIMISSGLDYATNPIQWIAINRNDAKSSTYFVAGGNILGTDNIAVTSKPLDNQYHVFSIIVTTSYFRFLIDYEKVRDDISHSVTDLNLYITAIRNWDTTSSTKAGVVDWVRVRKYTDPEPSVTVIRLGTTPTYELKLKIAQALAGETTTILDTDPKLRLLSGTDIIKELSLTAKTVYKDSVNNKVVVAFLFVDDSSDSYTTDNQELLFTKDSMEYVAFKSSKTFTKVADKRLPLRWEIYLPYDVDVCTYEETMISCL